MSNTKRVDKDLFVEGTYIGKPADADDEIILRRIRLMKEIPGFFDKEKTLVEVGCGNGATLFHIHSEFKRCLGVDILDEYGESINKFVSENDIHNLSFNKLNVEETPLNQKFDRLVSFEVIEHLETDKSVSEFLKLLKPGYFPDKKEKTGQKAKRRFFAKNMKKMLAFCKRLC